MDTDTHTYSLLTKHNDHQLTSPFPPVAAMNTPTAFYEQRQRLDMAKKHDILKQKMQRRPDREELVRQHILEGEEV